MTLTIRDHMGSHVVAAFGKPAAGIRRATTAGELARRVAELLGYETGVGVRWTLAEARTLDVLHYRDAAPSKGEWDLVEVGGRV